MSLFIGKNGEARVVLPIEAVTQTFAMLGMRGSGKTASATVLVEEMVGAGQPVVIVDPTGVWFGIRSSADGTAAGLPVVIFGGEHADVPLDEGGGALLAEYLVTARVPALLDLSHLRKGAQRRFMTDFAETLYHRNRAPLHVVLDECDLFAPQRVPAGAERLLGAIDDLARRGRARGIGLTLISQRPAVVNKDALTQTGTMLAFRLTAPQDRGAIDEWIRAHGTEEQRQELLGSLAGLPVGTAWLSSPGWLQSFQRIAVRRRSTFDSSRTPEIGEVPITPRALASIDLDAVRAQMAALAPAAAQAKGKGKKGPTVAKTTAAPSASAETAQATEARRIVELEELLAARNAEITRLENRLATVHGIVARASELLRRVPDALREAAGACEEVVHRLDVTSGPDMEPAPAARPPVVVGAGALHTVAQEPVEPAARSNNDLDKGERAVLTALAQYAPKRLTARRIAILTGYSMRGGRFQAILSGLRKLGWADHDAAGDAITPAGIAALGAFEKLPVGRALGTYWTRRLDKMAGRILGWPITSSPLMTSTAV